MVGDRVDCDIAGARAAGIQSALLRTGEFQESDLGGTVQPDYVFDGVADVGTLF